MRKSSAIALLLLCVSLTTYAQTSVPAKLEQYMERYTTFNDFGGAVLVLKGDKAAEACSAAGRFTQYRRLQPGNHPLPKSETLPP